MKGYPSNSPTNISLGLGIELIKVPFLIIKGMGNCPQGNFRWGVRVGELEKGKWDRGLLGGESGHGQWSRKIVGRGNLVEE